MLDMSTSAPTAKIKRRRVKVDVRAAVRDWLLKDDAAKQFGAEASAGKAQLMEILEVEGVTDDQGHQWINFPDDPVEGRVQAIKREKRVSKPLNAEAAEKILRKKGLYDQCTEQITVLNEEVILGLLFQKLITDKEAKEMWPEQVGWAFVPQRMKR